MAKMTPELSRFGLPSKKRAAGMRVWKRWLAKQKRAEQRARLKRRRK